MTTNEQGVVKETRELAVYVEGVAAGIQDVRLSRAGAALKALCDELQLLRGELTTFASSESELKDILSCDKCDLCEDHHA